MEIRHYHGHGFGSIFARLFSKIAAKTALNAAMVADRKVLRVATKQGSCSAWEPLKRELKSLEKLIKF